MTDKAQDEIVHTTTLDANKRAWVAPQIETAPAHGANAFGGNPGGADYAIYS